ncbi:hypothetical protein ES703_111995 [subsurface metagenome]
MKRHKYNFGYIIGMQMFTYDLKTIPLGLVAFYFKKTGYIVVIKVDLRGTGTMFIVVHYVLITLGSMLALSYVLVILIA